MVCQLVIGCQLSMVLMDGHGAALMPSQAHAKPNKEEMLGAFVTQGVLNPPYIYIL